MSKPKLLFLTTDFPYPPLSGGTIKTSKLLEKLAESFEVSAICRGGYINASRANEYLSEPRPRNGFNWLRAMIAGKSLNEFRNWSVRLKSLIETQLATADLVVVDHFEMMQYIGDCKIPVVFHTHNAEHKLWNHFSQNASNLALKLILKIEATRMRKREKLAIEKASLVFAASNDIKSLRKISDQEIRFEPTYHLGDDKLLQAEAISRESTHPWLFYAGTLDWKPNEEGLSWFLQKCWPLVLKMQPNTELHLAGKSAPASLRNQLNQSPNVRYHGFVDDLNSLRRKCRVCIVPQLSGSGMKIKVLEAMYLGHPLVCSSVAAESIDLIDFKHALIADQPQQFATAILKLLDDQMLWRELSANSRHLANAQYQYAPMLDAMMEAIEATISRQ